MVDVARQPAAPAPGSEQGSEPGSEQGSELRDGGPAGPDDGPPSGRGSTHVRRAIVRFSVSSVLALIVIGAGTAVVAERASRGEVLRHAERMARAIAVNLVAPRVDDRLRRQDPAALAELDRVMSNRMGDGSLARVKLWSADAQVLWSDDERLIGQRFDLEPADADTLATLGETAEFSDLDREENLYEQGPDELVEVYVGFRDPAGQPLLFEAYLPLAGLEAESEAQLRTLLPFTLGGPLLLLLVLFPLALSMARRVDRAGSERAALLRHAVEASALERRRIAGDLHDGVVQDLAGIGYALPSISASLGDGPATADVRSKLERVTGIIKADVAALRSVINDIYPPDLREGGLVAACEQLAAETRRTGLGATLDIEPAVVERRLPVDATVLAYRVLREALRNVVRHAAASTVAVTIRAEQHHLVVRVVDDGRGFDPTVPARKGHYGLRLLSDTVRDVGGSLDIRSSVGHGTEVTARFPTDWGVVP